MKVIGFRCGSSEFSYAVLEGDKANPRIIVKDTVSFPKNYSRPQVLKWLYQEMQQIFTSNDPNAIVLKRTEGSAPRGKSFVERVENEAIVLLMASQKNVYNITGKVKSTIAKNLGFKGRARYLKGIFIGSPISEVENSAENIKDAVMAAWSELSQ